MVLSQFLHGEQGALLATASIVNTVPWTEAKFYAANPVRRGAPRRLRDPLAPGSVHEGAHEHRAEGARGIRDRGDRAQLQILEFASLPDSTTDSETVMPPALLAFFARLQAAGIRLPGLALTA